MPCAPPLRFSRSKLGFHSTFAISLPDLLAWICTTGVAIMTRFIFHHTFFPFVSVPTLKLAAKTAIPYSPVFIVIVHSVSWSKLKFLLLEVYALFICQGDLVYHHLHHHHKQVLWEVATTKLMEDLLFICGEVSLCLTWQTFDMYVQEKQCI